MLQIRAAVGLLAAVLAWGCKGGDGAGPPAPGLADPAALTSKLAAVNRAANVAPLQSLGAVAVPLYLSNLDVNSITGFDLNHTRVWDPNAELYVGSSRTDAPDGAVRVVLYAIDSTSGFPAVPLVEVGTVDLYPRNDIINGPLVTDKMRYVVSDTGMSPAVFADFTAVTRYEPGCLCATVAGWVTDGVTRLDFSAPYSIIFGGVATFTGQVTTSPQSLPMAHVGVLPPLGDSTMSADARFAFLGDSLESQGYVSFHASGPPTATFTILVNGRTFATASYTAGAETFSGPSGRVLSAAEQTAVRELAAMPLGLALNVEFPTLTTFYCGC